MVFKEALQGRSEKQVGCRWAIPCRITSSAKTVGNSRGGLVDHPKETPSKRGVPVDISVELTAIFLPIITVVFWVVQRRTERRNRAIELYRHYETESMKNDRRDAWRYVRGGKGPVVPIGDLGDEMDPDRLDAYRACFGVLTFFLALRRLVDAGHADRRIVFELFEEPRSTWAEKFAPITDTIRQPGKVRLVDALQAIQTPFRPGWRFAGSGWRRLLTFRTD